MEQQTVCLLCRRLCFMRSSPLVTPAVTSILVLGRGGGCLRYDAEKIMVAAMAKMRPHAFHEGGSASCEHIDATSSLDANSATKLAAALLIWPAFLFTDSMDGGAHISHGVGIAPLPSATIIAAQANTARSAALIEPLTEHAMRPAISMV